MRVATVLIFLCSAAAGAETSRRADLLDFKAPPGADPAALEIFRKGLVALAESERVLGPVAVGSLLDEALAGFSEARKQDGGPLLSLTHRYEIIARETRARLEVEATPPLIDKQTLELLRERAGLSAPDHFDLARDLQAAGQYVEAARSYDAYISRLGSAATLIRWRYPLRSKVWGPSMKGTVLFFKDRKTVHAVDTDTGEAVWKKSVRTSFTKAPIQEMEKSVYVLSRDRLLGLDKETGEIKVDIHYDTKFSDRTKWNSPNTLYVDAGERGAVVFCGPSNEGKGREYFVEVIYFDLAAGTSRMSRLEKAWAKFVGGRHGDIVWYTNSLGRRGLKRADVTAIDLASGKEASLPDDAPHWKKSTPGIRAMTAEVYRYGDHFPNVINANGCVYHWKDKKTVEKRSKDGELLWSYTSQEQLPKLIGISRAGPLITGHGGDLYCVNELRPARAGDPTKMQALLEKGRCLSAAGKLAEAEEVLRVVLKDKPYLARAHYELGWIKFRQGRSADALHTLDTAESLFQTEFGWKKVCLSHLKEHGGLLAKVPGAGGGGVNGNIVTEDYCYNPYEGAYSDWATGAFWQKKIRTGAVCIDGGKVYRTSLDVRNLRDRNLEILDLKTGKQIVRLTLPGRCIVGTFIPHAKGPFRANMKHIAERDGYVFCVDESAKGRPAVLRAVCTTDRTRDWELVLPITGPTGLDFTEPVGAVQGDRLFLSHRAKLMAIDLTERVVAWQVAQSHRHAQYIDVRGNLFLGVSGEHLEYDPGTGRLLGKSRFPLFGHALASDKYYFYSKSNGGMTTFHRTRTGEVVWSLQNRGWYRHGFKYGRFRGDGLYLEGTYGIALLDPATGAVRETWPYGEMAFGLPTAVFLDDALVIVAQRAQRAFFYKFKDPRSLKAWHTGRRR